MEYPIDFIGQYILGNCLEVMEGIPDGCIDAIITDLPYGTTKNPWDAVIPFGPMWGGVKRILKKGGVFATTASQPFTSKLILSNLEWFKYEWIWHKSNSTGHLDVRKRPLKEHENVVIFSEDYSKYHPQMKPGYRHVRQHLGNAQTPNWGDFSRRKKTESNLYYPKSILNFQVEVKHIHPTQKPVSLYEYLILTYTDPGDVVLDIAGGAGTTALAALKTGRRYIGIEIDPIYHGAAVARLRAAGQQLPLFPDLPAGQGAYEIPG